MRTLLFFGLSLMTVTVLAAPVPNPIIGNPFTTNRPPNTITNSVPLVQQNYIEVDDQAPGPLTNYWGSSTVVQEIDGFIKAINPINGALNVRAFGALGDGIADDTVAVQNAMAAFGVNGGTLFFPPTTAHYRFNITITTPMKIVGPAFIKDYSGLVNNFFAPAIPGAPVIQVGNGTALAKGVTLENVTLYSPASTGYGLFVNTAMECIFQNVSVWKFETNVILQAGLTQPCTLNRFYNFIGQAAVKDNTRVIYEKMPANQASFTTDNTFIAVHINGQAAGFTNAYAMEFDGTVPKFIAGYLDVQGGSGTGILLSKRDAGVLDPFIMSEGLNIDTGGGDDIGIECHSTYTSIFPYNKIRGDFYTSAGGMIRMASGEQFILPPTALVNPTLYQASVLSGLLFAKGTGFTNTGELYIIASADDGLIIKSTNSISLSGGTNGISLNGDVGIHSLQGYGGSLFIDYPSAIYGYTSLTQAFAMLNVSANNTQLKSHKDGVSMQFIGGTNGTTFAGYRIDPVDAQAYFSWKFHPFGALSLGSITNPPSATFMDVRGAALWHSNGVWFTGYSADAATSNTFRLPMYDSPAANATFSPLGVVNMNANTIFGSGTASFGTFSLEDWWVAKSGGSGGIGFGSGQVIEWGSAASTTVINGDVGLARSAAGVLKVTDGSTGYGHILANRVGAGSIAPRVNLDIAGAMAFSPTATSLVGDNTTIGSGTSLIELNSDDVTAVNRTILLNASAVRGQPVTLYLTNGAAQLIDDAAVNGGAGTYKLKGDWEAVTPNLLSLIYDGSNFVEVSRSNPTVPFQVACSDLTTALTAGTTKAYFRVPYAMRLTSVRASLLTAQTSGAIFTVDIHESGTTILSTKLTIDNTEKTSTTAAAASVLGDVTLADDAEVTFDIDQVGDGTAKGLIVTIIGYRQ